MSVQQPVLCTALCLQQAVVHCSPSPCGDQRVKQGTTLCTTSPQPHHLVCTTGPLGHSNSCMSLLISACGYTRRDVVQLYPSPWGCAQRFSIATTLCTTAGSDTSCGNKYVSTIHIYINLRYTDTLHHMHMFKYLVHNNGVSHLLNVELCVTLNRLPYV